MPTPSPSEAGMKNPPPSKKPAVMLIAGLVIGAVAGYGVSSLTAPSQKDYDHGFDAGYQTAQQKLKDSNLFPELPTETNVLSGTVSQVDKDSFIFETQDITLNPLDAKNIPSVRTVKITDRTHIYRTTTKDPEEFQAEFDRFQEAGDPEALPPEPFLREDTDASAIKTGMLITVTADHNIFSEENFEAVEISLQSQPVTPSIPEEENLLP